MSAIGQIPKAVDNPTNLPHRDRSGGNLPLNTIFLFAEKTMTNRILSDFHHRISRLGGNRIWEVRFSKTKKKKKIRR